MTTVGVVAHSAKTLGGGLPELRRVLAAEGVSEPLWQEVAKSKYAVKAARKALDAGTDLLLVWGGDGTVQRVIDAVAGSGVTVGVLPAGTANLFATNLGIPKDIAGAVQVALHGDRRCLDVGVLNGTRFGVMAGVGFDASMIEQADRSLKDRWGRLAYVWTGIRASGREARTMTVTVDGNPWFEGKATCVLLGCFGTLTGGLVAFPDADPSDGMLEVGVVTAEGRVQWARVLGRVITRSAERSPLTRMTRGRKIDVKLDRPVRYELDGGAQKKKRKRLRATVEPRALHVAVPTLEKVGAK